MLNIGANRWSFKPEIGISHALERWTLEGAAAVTLFTDNDDFLVDSTREQDAIYSFQAHAIYTFGSGLWGALNATYYTGGESEVDGVGKNDRQRHWRGGATLTMPVDRRNSIKLYANRGVSSRTGSDFDLFGIAWQYRWGGRR